MALSLLLVVGGLALLTAGADRFVLAAARLSRTWGLSPVLIGAIVIGMGTSLPELLVSLFAAGREGGLDLAVGNVVGSNVANLTLVLGTSVLVAPIAGQIGTVRREGVLMAGGVLLFSFSLLGGGLTRIEGIALLAAMGGAMALLVVFARSEPTEQVTSELEQMLTGMVHSVRYEVTVGVAMMLATLAGARLLITGAERVAVELGVAEGVVGLTLLAVGTSLPELATAVAAARRRENELVVGNVLGSNLFNSLLVAGGVAVLGPDLLQADFAPAVLAMVAVSLLAGALAATGNRLARWEGALLLASYAGFVAFAL